MKLTIKVLQGTEFEIQVSEDATIWDVKNEIGKSSAHPKEYQKLLSSGRTLLDEKTLEFYKIKDGAKLMLVIKKPEPFKDVLLKNLKKYYTEDVAERIVKEFLDDYEMKINAMSLDDLERLAENILVK